MRCAKPTLAPNRHGANITMSVQYVSQVAIRVPSGLPPDLQALFEEMLAKAPAYIDRRTGAVLVTKHLFPVSHRSIEAWALPTRLVNGRAVVPTAKLLEIAFGKLTAAPVVMGGRNSGDGRTAA
jgi:hypothetical protein